MIEISTNSRTDKATIVEAKGRHGYFRVDHIQVHEHTTGSAQVSCHFLSSRSGYPGPCWIGMPAADAEVLAKALLEMAALARAYFQKEAD